MAAHDARVGRIDRFRLPLDKLPKAMNGPTPRQPQSLLRASVIRWSLRPTPPETEPSTGLAAFSCDQPSHRAPPVISFPGFSASPHNQLPPPWSGHPFATDTVVLADPVLEFLQMFIMVHARSMNEAIAYCVSQYIVYAAPIALSCRIMASREAGREEHLIRPCVAFESALSSSSHLSTRPEKRA